MEQKKIAITVQMPSIDDVNDGWHESVQILREKLLDTSLIDFISQMEELGFSLNEINNAYVGALESRNLSQASYLIDRAGEYL